MISALVIQKDVGGSSFQAVLTDDNRTLFAFLQVLRNEQHAISENVWEDIEHHFVTSPIVRFPRLSRASVERQQLFIEVANHFVAENVAVYRERRDAPCEGLGQPGEGSWKIEKPLATMFVWARIPEPFQAMGSLEFSKRLLAEAKVAVSPGIGFGATGEGYVRFALVENRHRIRQAVRGIRRFVREGGAGHRPVAE